MDAVGFVRPDSAVRAPMFYTEGDTLIPVPRMYQHLFPEEYPDASDPNKHP